ncbi:hypothetical protein [Rhizobium sp. BE258]|uniref:hypothetical protein n=1 Tax=Rhizobium sp. BE258 TaxID=2817722 RepID=UPI002865DC1B|nr:hypothetical protein [Rhizobium sp. BE258]MDR7146161.1 hypothetical protein [Rhizobium sp. BE258]
MGANGTNENQPQFRFKAGALAEALEVLDEMLRSLAAQTGEMAFVRAANALYQQPGGRPVINDEGLIEEARWLLQRGKAKSLNQALRKVAATVSDGDGIRSIAERLRRKMRADEKIDPRNSFSG